VGKGLTTRQAGLKYREIPANYAPALFSEDTSGFMTSKSPTPPQSADKKQPCKHPRVQIVSRDEDAEFVECLECGEIFDYSELKDMSIEDRSQSTDL
jgi:hypothetical protein